jgi:hypothetical protein
MTKKSITHLFITFFILNTCIIFAQDSLRRKKTQHEIGFGLQFTSQFRINLAEYSGSAEYKLPGYNLFYRYLLSKNDTVITAFSGGFFYRHGYGSSGSSSHGFGSYSNGNFEFVDFTIGVSKLKKCGKRKNFNIGAGVNVGAIIYSKGVTSDLMPVYLSMNFEMSQAFKLSPKNYLVLGFKQFLETNDISSARSNVTSSLFVTFNIR